MKGGFNAHKYSSRCPHLTQRLLNLECSGETCCVYLSRTSWSITPRLGWTPRSWRWVSRCHMQDMKWWFSVCKTCAFLELVFLTTTSLLTSKQKAVEVMCFVPKRCNDMMNVGRLQGFEVRLRDFHRPSNSAKHFSCRPISPRKTALCSPLPQFFFMLFYIYVGVPG